MGTAEETSGTVEEASGDRRGNQWGPQRKPVGNGERNQWGPQRKPGGILGSSQRGTVGETSGDREEASGDRRGS